MLFKWFRLQHVIINIKYIRQYGIYRLIKLMGRGLLRLHMYLLVSERVYAHILFFHLIIISICTDGHANNHKIIAFTYSHIRLIISNVFVNSSTQIYSNKPQIDMD